MRDVFAIKMLALVFDAALLFYTFVAAFVVDGDETGGESGAGGSGGVALRLLAPFGGGAIARRGACRVADAAAAAWLAHVAALALLLLALFVAAGLRATVPRLLWPRRRPGRRERAGWPRAETAARALVALAAGLLAWLPLALALQAATLSWGVLLLADCAEGRVRERDHALYAALLQLARGRDAPTRAHAINAVLAREGALRPNADAGPCTYDAVNLLRRELELDGAEFSLFRRAARDGAAPSRSRG